MDKEFDYFSGEDEDSEEEMSSPGCSSEKTSFWESLPDVCLQQIFMFLSDRDRRSADLVCYNWHNVMRSPSLWRSHYFYFNGRLSKYRPSEYCAAVGFIRSVGVYLQRLKVCVCPPRRSLMARRLEQTISGMFFELTRVNAPLKSLSLNNLELDGPSWTTGVRTTLVNSLSLFLRRGTSRLNTVSLNGMRICLNQGFELLSTLVSYHGRHISSLDLNGFFSNRLQLHLNSSMPRIMRSLPGLSHLGLSYSCVSDELLTALQHRKQRRRHVNPLQTLSLYCNLNESHEQVVYGGSWASLVSTSPDLRVKIIVDQIINTDRLGRILLPEIPLTEYTMTAFYDPDVDWSAKPLLRRLLPQYRHSLQYLALELSNCSETLDRALLELVKVCDCLEELKVLAFLEVSTVQGLLHIRLTQRSLLNKIRVRIYSENDESNEQQAQLEEVLTCYPNLPPELDFNAIVYPFV
ncbi:F-box only protein 39-like [Centropristis striata]|uniref:F-box only protein 39-like n=1 Tax=Centropristis striata TaxID=184440 RepID=UPI0027DEC246|nr:F-box only protein 39-like [Centropristis striata]